jgi:hypothetical protein
MAFQSIYKCEYYNIIDKLCNISKLILDNLCIMKSYRVNKPLIYSLLLCWLSWVSVPCVAQVEDNRENFRIGIKAGLNNSNVYDEAGDQFVANSKLGYVFGGFMCIPLDKTIGFQPEVLMSQKGFDASGIYFGNRYNFTRTTTYLDIPLQLQIKANSALAFVIGPQYSYLMKTKDEFSDGTVTLIQEQEISNDNYRKNLLGFVLGADAHLNSLVLSARAGWDITRNHGDGTSSNPRYKNHWLQFTVGLAF